MLLKVGIFILIILTLVIGYTMYDSEEGNYLANQSGQSVDSTEIQNELAQPIHSTEKQDEFDQPIQLSEENNADEKDSEKNMLLAEESAREKESRLEDLKSRLAESLATSDTATLNDLMHEVKDHPDQEAALQIFKKAMDDQKAKYGSLYGQGSRIQSPDAESSAAPDNSTDNSAAPANSENSDQEKIATTAEETSDFSDLQARAYDALQISDTSALNQIMHEIANHSDQQGALEAFAEATKQNNAGKSRSRLR